MRFPRRLVLLSAFVLFLMTVSAARVDTQQMAVAAGNATLLWGAYIDYGSGNPVWGDLSDPSNGVNVFESHAGKKASILHFGLAWKNGSGSFQPFPLTAMNNIRSHGSIPMVNWGSWQLGLGTNQSAFRNAAIARGDYDAYISQWATDAKNWGYPFFLRFDHEMNGWWYPWSEGQTSVGGPIVNGNQVGDYVRMWQHVHDIFTQVGATNVTWVWCPNYAGLSGQNAPFSQVFPGENYIDWSGLDAYNDPGSAWISFNTALTGSGTNWLDNSYGKVVGLAPSKPMMLAEFASIEDKNGDTQRKADWITDALLTQIPGNFPAIRALVWFEWNDGNSANTYYIESSTYSQNAFAGAVSSSLYADNSFGALVSSPIGPPSPGEGADVQPPVTAISSPLDGARVSGVVPVAASASDNVGVTRVELYVNNSLYATLVSSPYTFTWDTTAMPDGSYSLHTLAYDAAGAIGASAPVHVSVGNDSTPPTISITNPKDGSVVARAKSVTIAASASDNVGVTRVEFYVGGTLTCTDTVGPYTCAWQVPGKGGAKYALTAKAYDAAGNIGTSNTVNVTASSTR
ncbi:MAG: Ig-like domain-containing protein [Rudaea sp.]